MLVLVPGIGNLANGSRKWFVIAGFSMQPSELAKIAFAIWGAHLLAARRMERASLREMLIPLVPAAVIALALIVAQPDLGQTVSLGIILLGLLWYAGLPLRVFVSSLVAVFVAGAILAMSAGYRSDRVRSWLDPENDPRTPATRPDRQNSRWPTAASSVTVSARASPSGTICPTPTTTSSSPSSARNSGFIGALGLLGLFGLFAYTGMRIARRSADPFLRLLTATTTMWVLGQAFINIGYVIGVLPVTGLQLPLISAGGTSTATTLFMIGIMANAARHEPEAVAALRAGRRRQDEPAAAAAAAGAVRADPPRVVPRPQAHSPATGLESGKAAGARRAGARAKARARRGGRAARRSAGTAGSRERHHGSGQRHAVTGPASVSHGALAHWKVSVTGERHGQRSRPAGGGKPLPAGAALSPVPSQHPCRSCLPAAVPPAMWSLRWPSPTR